MIQIDLPDLEDSFKEQLLKVSENVATNIDSVKRRLDHCIRLDRKDIVQDEYVYLDNYQDYLDNIFAERLGGKITYYLIVARNVIGLPSYLVRHSDDVRHAGINYYLELGGESVITNFYTPNKTSYIAEKGKYYIFQGGVDHEVLNITSTRVVLGMDLDSLPTYEEYQQLLL